MSRANVSGLGTPSIGLGRGSQRVHNDALDVALGEQEFHDLDMETGSMQRPIASRIAEFRRAEVSVPASSHGDDGTGGKRAVLGFPSPQVVEREFGVGIVGGFPANVHDSQRPDKVGGGNEISRVFVESVQRRRITEAAFTPDGQAFLSRSPGGAVKFTMIDGQQEKLTEDRIDRVNWSENTHTLGFDDTGKLRYFPVSQNCLCLAGNGKTLQLRRQFPGSGPSTDEPRYPFNQRTEERIDGLLLSRDGRSGVTHGHSGNLEIWDLESGRLRWCLREPKGASGVSFSPDGQLLAVGVLRPGLFGSLRFIRVFRVADGRMLVWLKGHTGQGHRTAFGPDGTWLVSTGGRSSRAVVEPSKAE